MELYRTPRKRYQCPYAEYREDVEAFNRKLDILLAQQLRLIVLQEKAAYAALKRAKRNMHEHGMRATMVEAEHRSRARHGRGRVEGQSLELGRQEEAHRGACAARNSGDTTPDKLEGAAAEDASFTKREIHSCVTGVRSRRNIHVTLPKIHSSHKIRTVQGEGRVGNDTGIQFTSLDRRREGDQTIR